MSGLPWPARSALRDVPVRAHLSRFVIRCRNPWEKRGPHLIAYQSSVPSQGDASTPSDSLPAASLRGHHMSFGRPEGPGEGLINASNDLIKAGCGCTALVWLGIPLLIVIIALMAALVGGDSTTP